MLLLMFYNNCDETMTKPVGHYTISSIKVIVKDTTDILKVKVIASSWHAGIP